MKDESHIVGREDLLEKLASRLIDEGGHGYDQRVLLVAGEEAVGKTALVRSVCSRADVKNHFDRCAWVRVGRKPNRGHLMADLLKQLSVTDLPDVDRLYREKLSKMLWGVLRECRYLIVLDDLCEFHIMEDLMEVLFWGRNGVSVIITTRNPDITLSIDFELKPLNEEKSEQLLKKSSPDFDVDDPPLKIHRLKEMILSKSGGSPLKILLLGGLLSTTTLDRCTELATGLPDRPTLHDVVRLSVNDLPEGLKQCALYLTLFPKESEIPTRRLFRLWSAENLVSSALQNGVNRVDAEKCFKILVSRNMVHVARQKWDGSARSCCLPGSLYDIFYQMAKNERFLNVYHRSFHDKKKFDAPRIAMHRDISGGGEANAQKNMPEAGRERSETNAEEAHMEITLAEPHQRLSVSDNSMPCNAQQLCCYMSFNTLKLGTMAGEIQVLLKPLVPKRNSSLLRVLDLEGVYRPSLPTELGEILPNLKYLGLRWTLLEWLPESVVLLSRLETLDVKYTNISDLGDSILGAENLRYLYMPKVGIYRSRPKISLNCNIQTIWGLYIANGESPMWEVLRRLTGLRKLALTWRGRSVSEAAEPISNLKLLESLSLQSDQSDEPSDLELSDMTGLESLSNLYLRGKMQSLSKYIPRNLKVLTLSMSRLKDDPMEVLGGLECLITLRLFSSSYDGQALNVSEGTFPRLRVLKLWKLEELTDWTISTNAMPCLQDLEIKECKQLQTIAGLERIETLEGITLVKVANELERCVRKMCPNVPMIAKELAPERRLSKRVVFHL
ncbi:hypothetical protein BT93_G1508 [Corymbia citriodora subsp. variegata]|nr:hypothetical protein BT93_G1508 [Corymbia citriodora subsp. variegata]